MFPIVLADGQFFSGALFSKYPKIFFGPQKACSFLISRTCSTSSLEVLTCECLALLRSLSPPTPSASNRSIHLYAVLRLMLNALHNLVTVSRFWRYVSINNFL